MIDIQLIGGIKKTFAKRQVINSVEHVGFSGTVLTNKTIQLRRKLGLHLQNIFKIYN
jgi:hypothetical protein